MPTAGENLRIQRRRQNWGLTEAASFYRVSMAKYASWELDLSGGAPRAKVGLLCEHEVCFLALGRHRMGLDQTAKEFGLDRGALHEMLFGRTPCVSLTLALIDRGML